MKCCVLGCKNYTDRIRSVEMNAIDISFHRFPTDNKLKKIWIATINRENWTPTKYTRICSNHFNSTDFDITPKGHKRLIMGSLPSLRLDTPDKIKPPPEPTSSDVCEDLVKTEPSSSESTSSGLCEYLVFNDTPREKVLKEVILQLRSKAKSDKKKIRRLQMKLNRLQKKLLGTTSKIGRNRKAKGGISKDRIKKTRPKRAIVPTTPT